MRTCSALVVLLGIGALVVGCDGSPTDAGLTGSALEPATIVATTQPVVVIVGGAVVGEATIRRNPNGASATFQTTELTPGNAYTFWWVVFGNPEECAGSPCMAADLANPLVNGGFIRAAGRLVGADGKANFGYRLNLGDVLTGGNTFGNTFDDVLGSEMHIVVRDHGPALPGQLQEQLFEFNGGCPPGPCVNVQVSRHLAP